MTSTSPAPASRRSLAASAVIGACVGLAIGSAYIAGALSRAEVDAAEARLVAGTTAALPRPIPPAVTAPAAPTGVRLGQQAAPVRLAHVDLRGSVAPARDLECLSQAVYYEARGEAERGRQAVAQVVMNRTRHPRFPKSICAVVFQHASSGCAFSFACDGQTRHALEPGAWRDARRIAQRTLAGFVLPDLRSATDFRSGGGGVPTGLERVAQIGAHVFYRFTGRAVQAARPSPPAPTRVAVAVTAAATAPGPASQPTGASREPAPAPSPSGQTPLPAVVKADTPVKVADAATPTA